MRSMSSLIHKLTTDYPQFTFFKTELFSWSPSTQTVSYNPDLKNAPALLLHEVSHAVLGHTDYQRDVELLGMETVAWEKARELAEVYSSPFTDDVAENHLDTYREWLHARSTCPACTATGYQTGRDTYACPACSHEWRVNEARICGLKRYSVTK